MIQKTIFAVRDSSGCTAFFLSKIQAEEHFLRNALGEHIYEIPLGKLCQAPAGWKDILNGTKLRKKTQ